MLSTEKREYTGKLTPYGEKVAKYLRAERRRNIERNHGEYVPEPWYKRYLTSSMLTREEILLRNKKYDEEEAKLKEERQAERKKNRVKTDNTSEKNE